MIESRRAELEAVARVLRLDAPSLKKAPLPLVDASSPGPLAVVRGAWGVDARVDQRGGHRVLRLCPADERDYDDVLRDAAEPAADDDAALASEFALRVNEAACSVVLDDGDRARREVLRVEIKRVDVSCRAAVDGAAGDDRAGATLDASVGDCRVESHARGARLRVVLERDGGEQAHAVHASLARQRDGAAEVWRYAGLDVAPLSFALDRATLAALCACYESVGSPVLGSRTSKISPAAAWAARVADAARGCEAPVRWAATARERRVDAGGGGGGARAIFASMASEPRLFVDAIEIAPAEVRCTLALAATASTTTHDEASVLLV